MAKRAKRVVILGAGIGGLSIVKELNESGMALDDVDLTMVAENFDHFLGFTLPWVMRGWRNEDSVPIRPTAESLSGITTITGAARSIDTTARTVELADSSRIPFDALVIATGARNAIDRVPGLRAAVDNGSAVHYYSADAAAAAHRALSQFTGGRLTFLVTSLPYRCPVAPYEGTLLAADLLAENGRRGTAEIAIYTPEQHPMPSAGPYAGPELVNMLGAKGVGFFGEHAVAGVDPDGRVVTFQNGGTADFDLLVFIPPHEPTLRLDGQEWIGVDPATMQTAHPGIFAIGDITVIKGSSGQPLPKAATFARNGAAAAAQSLLNHLGKTHRAGVLSGRGYCYIDTGRRQSTRGLGDFFAQPHPDIRLSPPSAELYHSKEEEERAWRTLWERGTRFVPATA